MVIWMEYWQATTSEHVLYLEPLARAALMESTTSKVSFCTDKFQKIANDIEAAPSMFGMLIASNKNAPVGFAYCTAGEHFIGTGARFASVQGIFVETRIRRSLLGGRIANSLINGAQHWAKLRLCQSLTAHITSAVSTRTTDRLLFRRRGQYVGGNFVF
ncbi:MAG: hypothetical protein AAGF60_04600 [Pseudomonadota bacterium]